MKKIDIKSLIIGALLTSTIFFGVAGGGAPGGGFVGPAGGGGARQVDPTTGLPLLPLGGGRGAGAQMAVDPVTGLPVGGVGGRPGGLPGMGMGMAGGSAGWNPNQVWEVKSYLAIAGKPQPEKGLIVQGHEPFAVDERGNIMFRRRVR